MWGETHRFLRKSAIKGFLSQKVGVFGVGECTHDLVLNVDTVSHSFIWFPNMRNCLLNNMRQCWCLILDVWQHKFFIPPTSDWLHIALENCKRWLKSAVLLSLNQKPSSCVTHPLKCQMSPVCYRDGEVRPLRLVCAHYMQLFLSLGVQKLKGRYRVVSHDVLTGICKSVCGHISSNGLI